MADTHSNEQVRNLAVNGAARAQSEAPEVAGLIWAMLDMADAVREQTAAQIEQTAALIDFMGNSGVRTVEMNI